MCLLWNFYQRFRRFPVPADRRTRSRERETIVYDVVIFVFLLLKPLLGWIGCCSDELYSTHYRVAGLFFAVDGSIVIFFPFCAPLLVNSPHFYSRLPFEIAKFGIIYPMMAALQRQKLLVRILFWLYFAHMNYRSNRLALYMYDDDNHYKHSIQEYTA